MKRTALIGTVLAMISFSAALPTFALSNAEFAKQVANYEKQIKADPKLKNEVGDFCQSLGKARRDDEPKCVALNKVAIDSVYGHLNSSRLRP